MKFKNFHSYFWYGVKNGRLNVVSIVINGILLFVAICGIRNDIWSEIENISVNGQRYVILAVALILADIIWQIYSFANELAACFKKESYTEHEENNVDFKKLVKDPNEKVETCTNGSFSYNPNVCEKLVKHNDFKCVIREEAAEMVDNYVKGNFDCLFPFLSQHYNNAQAHEKLFTNDKKLCLSGKLNPESENVSFYKGCYYHSYLTNNIFLKSLSFSGTSVHIYPMHGCSNKKVEIPFEYFSNEIGVSTIAITKDGYLFVQKQGERADASSGLFVPSGSGSADWKDYTQNKKKDQTLDAIISYSTKRELAEETGFEKSNPDKIVT